MDLLTPDGFFGKWLGKGIDFDGYYSFQCMDLAQQYCKECIGHQLPSENAIDVWDNYPTDIFERLENTPTAIPVKGDIVLWSNGVGEFGHIAIFKDGDMNSFTSMDQNWPIGSICHFQLHSYKNVQGWLRKKEPVHIPVANISSSTSPSASPSVSPSTSNSPSASPSIAPEPVTTIVKPTSWIALFLVKIALFLERFLKTSTS